MNELAASASGGQHEHAGAAPSVGQQTGRHLQERHDCGVRGGHHTNGRGGEPDLGHEQLLDRYPEQHPLRERPLPGGAPAGARGGSSPVAATPEGAREVLAKLGPRAVHELTELRHGDLEARRPCRLPTGARYRGRAARAPRCPTLPPGLTRRQSAPRGRPGRHRATARGSPASDPGKAPRRPGTARDPTAGVGSPPATAAVTSRTGRAFMAGDLRQVCLMPGGPGRHRRLIGAAHGPGIGVDPGPMVSGVFAPGTGPAVPPKAHHSSGLSLACRAGPGAGSRTGRTEEPDVWAARAWP